MSSLKISNKEIITTTLVLITVVKILLIPSYKSTDFDVHRNWLAITKHLPLSEWYFDDVNGKTVHTLDYPPSFAFFESILVHNPITNWVVEKGKFVDERCFELLGDAENRVGLDCIIFQRATVIIADVVFWIGAYAMAQSIDYEVRCPTEGANKRIYNFKHVLAFLLTISNVGLLLLDHVHFQYNGMMLGILLFSLAALLKSITTTKPGERDGMKQQIALELLGAALFAFLLTMKHLYLTLAPVYFFYLLRRFCFTTASTRSSVQSNNDRRVFSFARLVMLGATVVITMVLPFLPFVMHSGNERSGGDQMKQIFSRLFPFQRGLCHDYWAGNVWALYQFLEKMAGYLVKIGRRFEGRSAAANLFQKVVPVPFPEITPLMTAVCLLVGLTPAMRCAWRMGSCDDARLSARDRQEGILYCIVYSSITSFMLAYHVHEKAIMTAIIPMTYLAFTSIEGSRLFLRLSTIGHFGLLPLLFRSNELLMKILLSLSFLALSITVLDIAGSGSKGAQTPAINRVGDKCGLFFMGIILSYSEVIHPLMAGGEMEFLPLMLVSITCAIGLMCCWIQCGLILMRF